MINKLFSAVTLAVAAILVVGVLNCKSSGQDKNQKRKVSSAMVADTLRFKDFKITDLKFSGEPYKLCEQKLTTEDYLGNLQPEDNVYILDYKYVPDEKTLLFPASDIRQTELVKDIQNRFNYVAVGDLVTHAEQVFYRKYTDKFGDNKPGEHRKEKLALIAEDCPNVPLDVLDRAFSDSNALASAKKLLDSYRKYDGNEEDGNQFWNTFGEYKSGFSDLPKITHYSMKEDSDNFWEWYNRKASVPEYDVLCKMRGDTLSAIETYHLIRVIECEKNIDRRAVLAIELTYHDPTEGIKYLGEIMESGIYTKYLLEVWLVWRAHTQILWGGASSFSVIPDNYYTLVKGLCINSLLRYIQQNPYDDHSKDLLLADYLMTTECIDRMGSDYGNECIITAYTYPRRLFIQPSAAPGLTDDVQ